MKQYITKLSKHCYYGNVVSILNYLGLNINEAELVLLSEGLNCSCVFKQEKLYWGIPIEYCSVGLEKLEIETVMLEDEEAIQNSAKRNVPFLLKIKASFLEYSYIFKEAERNHYIVVINEQDSKLLISDSFIPTIPLEIFQGTVEATNIYDAITQGCAKGYIFKIPNELKNTSKMCHKLFYDYLKKATSGGEKSIISSLCFFFTTALENKNQLFNKEVLSGLAYDLRYSGAIVRFEYLIYFIEQYCVTVPTVKEDVVKLKTRWELLSNKIMKCAITLKEQYYIKLFNEEIPALIEDEIHIYRNIIAKEKGFRYD